MSGKYPPYADGGQRRTYRDDPEYGEDPGYGEDPWYGDGRGYAGADERAYLGRQSDYDQVGYPAYRGDRSAVPAQGRPPRDAEPYPGDPYRPGPYDDTSYDDASYGGAPYRGPDYPDSSGYPSPAGYERHQGYPEREDYWDDRTPGHAWRADESASPGYPGPTRSAPAQPPTAVRAKRRGRTLAIAFSVTLVLLALVAFGGWRFARPFLDQWPATLDKPQQLAGLELSTEPALQQAANDIAADIRKDVKVDEAVAAFYHDPAAADKIVALVGGTAFLASPKAELEEAFRSARGEGMSIGEVVPVNAGPLGGLARCAAAEQQAEGGEAVPLSVCAWADHGSLLIGLFFHRSINESAELLRTIRGEILKR